MYLFYNVLLISVLIITSPLWIYKLFSKEKHRKGFTEKIGILPRELERPALGEIRVHIHAVSVGEVNAVTPFVKELKNRHPEIRLVLSTVTPAGNDMARRRLPEVDHILYFPFDLPWIVKKVIAKIRPHLYITVETELWPNFLRWIKRSGARSIIINGRISPRTFKGYSRIKPLMRRVLATVDLFCMQSDEDARKIRAIGAPDTAVIVTGNMKYDQRFLDVSEDEVQKKRALFGIERDDMVIIAGSTHRGEDEIIIKSHRECLKSDERIRLIIAPRHVERAGEIEKLVRESGFEVIKRTDISGSKRGIILSSSPFALRPVIIIDTLGELSTLYSMASVVIMGGSFIAHGGQNPLEAMFYRKPVIFGQHMFNFREIAEEILKNGAGIRVEKWEDLTKTLRKLINDPERQKEMGEKGYQIILKNKGAVERNLAMVEKFLSKSYYS